MSEREIEVLPLLADGKANKGVVLSLKISTNTVKSHVKQIYRKLEVASREGMYAQAREMNLLE